MAQAHRRTTPNARNRTSRSLRRADGAGTLVGSLALQREPSPHVVAPNRRCVRPIAGVPGRVSRRLRLTWSRPGGPFVMEPHTSDAPADPSFSLRQTRTQDPERPAPVVVPLSRPRAGPRRGRPARRLPAAAAARRGRHGHRVRGGGFPPRPARRREGDEAGRGANEEGRRRFLREARAAAAVEHDHVVPIHHVDEDGGTPYLVMPLLRGESLDARLRKRPRLPAAEAVRMRGGGRGTGGGARGGAGASRREAVQLVAGGDAARRAHQGGGFRVGAADGGRGGADGVWRFLGTAGYTSPEQARGETMDGRADLFSLGCVLYRMLTGHGPFQGKTLAPSSGRWRRTRRLRRGTWTRPCRRSFRI